MLKTARAGEEKPQELRRRLVHLVLATDMSRHFGLLQDFRQASGAPLSTPPSARSATNPPPFPVWALAPFDADAITPRALLCAAGRPDAARGGSPLAQSPPPQRREPALAGL